MICPPSPWAASAHSITALTWGYPTPVFFRVVQTEPGPIPTLIISAPDSISSSTISPVTTFPACFNITFSRCITEQVIKYHDNVLRESLTNASNVLNELFRVSVGHVQANVTNFRDGVQNLSKLFKITFSGTRRSSDESKGILVLVKSKSGWRTSVCENSALRNTVWANWIQSSTW